MAHYTSNDHFSTKFTRPGHIMRSEIKFKILFKSCHSLVSVLYQVKFQKKSLNFSIETLETPLYIVYP